MFKVEYKSLKPVELSGGNALEFSYYEDGFHVYHSKSSVDTQKLKSESSKLLQHFDSVILKGQTKVKILTIYTHSQEHKYLMGDHVTIASIRSSVLKDAYAEDIEGNQFLMSPDKTEFINLSAPCLKFVTIEVFK